MEKALDTEDVVVENDLKTQTLAEDEQRFEDNLQKFRTAVAGNEGKYNLIIAAQQGKVLRQLNVALDKVVGKQGESDFQIINLIRLLFLGDDKFPDIATAKTQVTKALSGFPFWPVKNKKKQPDFDKIVFWSENHLFMTLGSCYLFRQYDLNPEAKTAAPETQAIILQELNKKLETKLLKIYLRAHCLTEFNGLYEANSTVYLPYSLSGLLNLYDFSIDEEVKELAHKIIDRLIYHVMLCTTSNGVSNLCAGGRTFVRTRTRVVNHNMNQVTNLILGKSPDDMNPSAVTDYILTTSWRPNYSEVKEALIFTGTHPPLRMSHPYTSTRELYTNLAGAEEVPLCEITPLFWSAGLVTHPEFVVETRNYLHAKGMQSNHHLSALCYLPTWFVHRQMLHYATVSKGQMYTDIELNVFKHPEQNLLLSSFEKFNPHCSSFQQLPWMANIAGLGVWAQAGSGSEGIMNFGISNTHNPLITQKGSVLIASYIRYNIISYFVTCTQLYCVWLNLYHDLLHIKILNYFIIEFKIINIIQYY